MTKSTLSGSIGGFLQITAAEIRDFFCPFFFSAFLRAPNFDDLFRVIHGDDLLAPGARSQLAQESLARTQICDPQAAVTMRSSKMARISLP